jgi:hypothetical protein
MDKIIVELTKSKETKGTHVYANADEGLSIYIPKEKIKGSVPMKVTMTIEAAAGTPSASDLEM